MKAAKNQNEVNMFNAQSCASINSCIDECNARIAEAEKLKEALVKMEIESVKQSLPVKVGDTIKVTPHANNAVAAVLSSVMTGPETIVVTNIDAMASTDNRDAVCVRVIGQTLTKSGKASKAANSHRVYCVYSRTENVPVVYTIEKVSE